MADPKHLALLRQGVDLWNEWRENNYGIIPDLSGADLRGVNLVGADLSRANFHQANLSHANLFGVDLGAANLSAANLGAANLSGVFLNKANLRQANLRRTQLWVAQLFQADLAGAKLSETDLSDAELGRANLHRARLIRTNLCGANLGEARLTNAELVEVRGSGTNFQGATLTGMHLVSWNIDRTTRLSDAICDYIYLREYRDKLTCKIYIDERCPHETDRNFVPGEFAKLFQSNPDTIDFAFPEGIDWRAFLVAFEQLCRSIPENDFTIGTIDTRPGGAIVVRVRVCDPCNPEQVEQCFKQAYQHQLQSCDRRDSTQNTATRRDRSGDLLDIVRSLASSGSSPKKRDERDAIDSDEISGNEETAPWDLPLKMPPKWGELPSFWGGQWLI